MLNPTNFVSYEKTESIFQTPKKYAFHLSKKVEGDIDKDIFLGSKTYIADKDLRPIVKELSTKLFGNENHELLDLESRILIAKKLKHEYCSTPKQISRMIGLSVEILKGYI